MTKSKKKKSGENVNARLGLLVKSGKYTFGYRSNIKSLRSGRTKLIVIARNTPEIRKSELKYYALLAKCTVHHYQGGSLALGIACGRRFRCSTMAVTDVGDSEIDLVLGENEVGP